MAEWKTERALAERIVAGDREAWKLASRQIDDLAATEYLRFIDLEIPSEGPPAVRFGAQTEEIIPSKAKVASSVGQTFSQEHD